jgi:hypothetical protein
MHLLPSLDDVRICKAVSDRSQKRGGSEREGLIFYKYRIINWITK